MKNIVGQTPRGKDFFPRDHIVKQIYRRLDSGSNLYLAAPRRVGKTAIMRHLEDNPKKNYVFKYIITESVDNAASYFRLLLESLNNLNTLSQKSLDAVRNFIPKIEEVGIFTGQSIKFGKRDLFDEFRHLIEGLDTKGAKVIIMVDEFPQSVENILRKSGKEDAEQFLQFNRTVRHLASEHLRFIYTGSIGLHTVAERLKSTVQINDLNTVEIPPLSEEEASNFTKQLLDSAGIAYEGDAIPYLLNKIEWFVPFHIQLLVQELIDFYEDKKKRVNQSVVDKAFDKIFSMRYKSYFEHYYSRLEKTFDGNEYSFALELLRELSQREGLNGASVRELAEEHKLENCRMVLETLEFDGYIFRGSKSDGTFYRFTSPVLRLWWRKYVC